MNHVQTSAIRKIAVIGTYMPRQCGIATFTADFCEALGAQFPQANICAIPVNDSDEGYAYPSQVGSEIAERDIESYRQAAWPYQALLALANFNWAIFAGLSGQVFWSGEYQARQSCPIMTQHNWACIIGHR